jgi:MoaA/NifB/PqqE/SkfB family radical SAM enzyme
MDEHYNIRTHSVAEYFQDHMSAVRQSMLLGSKQDICDRCYTMEKHGKVSGRQRQLLKTGIMTQHFIPSLQSSPFVPMFEYSQKHGGRTNLLPVDWQIDLGNYCNNACVMCSPRYSSRISSEFQKIGLIDNAARWNRAWTDDEKLVEKFCQDLIEGPTPAYLHFLGGETLIVPALKKILVKLLAAGMSATAVGFTTNLTVWPDDVIDLLQQFAHLHVGLSIEALHKINHYVRWPSDQTVVLRNMERWINLSRQHGHLVQLRPTPSALTILHVADLYQFAWNQNIGFETCNFISNPRCLSLKVLPTDIREIAVTRLEKFLEGKTHGGCQTVNTRNPAMITQQIVEDVLSYIDFLKNAEHDPDGAQQLVLYLQKIESSRGNSILEYLPEYEKFLRSYGY